MKRLSHILSLLSLTALFTSCQIYGIVKDITDKEDGQIQTKDGRQYVGRVSMPNCNTKSITVNTLDSQHVKVASDEIAVLAVWKKTHPEKVHPLVHMPYKWQGKKKTSKAQWMAMIEAGEYLEFYALSYNYSLPSNGDIRISSVKGGSISYIGRRAGDSIGTVVAVNGYPTRALRKNMMEFLADDPVLCEKLKNMEIKPGDMETIAKEYNPHR